MKSAEKIVGKVFKRWKREVAPGWGDGIYFPSEEQFAEMAVEAINKDRAQRLNREPTPPYTGGTSLVRALAAWDDATAAYVEACEEEERSGREKDPEAYYSRDDAAVEFADAVHEFVDIMTGLRGRVADALAQSTAESSASDVLAEILALLEEGQQ